MHLGKFSVFFHITIYIAEKYFDYTWKSSHESQEYVQ